MISALTSVCLAALAFAHSGGHGAKIEGFGPNGGKLAPVILASEAEMGDKAKTRAVAEWKLEGEALKVSFWSEDRKTRLPLKAVNLKWILLGKKLKKPEVVSAGTELKSPTLRKADSVEIILPALGELGQKHVALIQLKD